MSCRKTAIAVVTFVVLFLLFSISTRPRSSTTTIPDPQHQQPSTSAHKPTVSVDDSDEQVEARLESECTQLWRNAIPSQHELALQKADFERELARQIAHLRTLRVTVELNDSPSTLERDLARRLWKQYHPTTSSSASNKISFFRYKPFFTLSSSSSVTAVSYRTRVRECEAWRTKVRLRDQQTDQETFAMLGNNASGGSGSLNRNGRHHSNDPASPESIILPSASSPISFEDDPTAAHAIAKFVQSHPNREPIQYDSIMAHTIAALAHKSFTDPSGFTVELDPIKILAGSRRASTFNNNDIHVLVLDSQPDPQVTVMVGNPVDEVVKLRQAGYRPALLNVANDKVPGGDYYLDSTHDREADLFRRTTLHQCLDQEPRRSQFFPLTENGGVYCPNQAVIRHGPTSNYDFMDRFEWISVVSVPRIPKLETREREDGMGVQFMEGEDDKVRRNILAAMKIGVSMGHDALVLPAHGTDQNQNPPDIIAAVYRSIIGRDFMGGSKRFQTYKKIIMVLDPDYAYKIVNETSSYRIPRPKPTPTPSPSADEIATPLPLDGEEFSSLNPRAVAIDDDASSPHNEDEEEVSPNSSEDWDEDAQADENDQDEGGEEETDITEPDTTIYDEIEDRETLETIRESERDSLPEPPLPPPEEDAFDLYIGDDQDDLVEINGDLTMPDDENDDEDGDGDGENDDDVNDILSQLEDEEEQSEFEALLEEQGAHSDYAVTDPEDEIENEDEALIQEHHNQRLAMSEDEDVAIDEHEHHNHTHTENDPEVTSVSTTEPQLGLPEGEVDLTQPFEEELAPFEETVLQVFERMLDQRSLLIIKNRGKGGAAAAPVAAAAAAAVADGMDSTNTINATEKAAGSTPSPNPLPVA